MLLKVFRSNQPFLQVFLPLVALIFWPFFADSLQIQNNYGGPLFDFVFKVVNQSIWLSGGSSIIIVFIGAILVNRIFNRFEFADKQTYLPALFYMLYNGYVIAISGLNPVQFGLIFVLVAVYRLLLTYRLPRAFSHAFDAGVLFGLAILISPPLVVALPWIWLALFRLRPFSWREWLIPLVGLACVAWITFAGYVCFDLKLNIEEFIDLQQFSWPQLLVPQWLMWILSGCTILITLAGLLLYISEMQISTVHRKNTKASFLWFSILLGLTMAYYSLLAKPGFALFAFFGIPFSIFAAVLYTNKKRTILKNSFFWVWLLAAVLIFYWSRWQ